MNAAISPGTTIIQAGRLGVDKELKEGQLRGILVVKGKIRKVLYDTGADKGFGSPAFLRDIKSKPIHTRRATIRAIDGSTLLNTDLKIHRITGTIPAFGPFYAQLGEMHTGDVDLVLGSDWLRANGLLDDLCKRLGIKDAKAPQKIEPLRESEIKINSEYRQCLINDLTRVSTARVNYKWEPPKERKYRPLNRRKFDDWRIELAAAFHDNPDSMLFREGDFTLPTEYWEYRDVFQPENNTKLPPHREGFDHAIDIEPSAQPPNRPQYRLSELELQATRDKIQELEERGLIRRSTSPCSAPILFAEKKGTTELRMCVDYRGLNKITKKNRYPLPLIDVLLDRVRGAKYFVKLDLRDAYHLIRIREGDEWKTAFKTRYGLFEWLVMPFGLCNTPATFQSYIDQALEGLVDEELVAYLDDILIYGDTLEEVQERTKRCLARLREWGLSAKLKKCQFHVQQVNFLGFKISADGIGMEEDLLQTIDKWPIPKGIKEVQGFLGTTGFYRRFIPRYSEIAKPLTDLTRGKGKNRSYSWGLREQLAFDKLKSAFQIGQVLAHYDPDKPSYVFTDACTSGASGILCQKTRRGDMRPIAIWSKKFSPSEAKYGTPDQELLAIVWAMERFRPYLQGAKHQTIVKSDHANLRSFTTTKDLNPLQTRWAERLGKFDFVIEHLAGRYNPADGPSRRPDYMGPLSEPQETKPFLNLGSPGEDKLGNEPVESIEDNVFIARTTWISDDLSRRIREALGNDELAKEARDILCGESVDDETPWEEAEGLLYYNGRVYIPEILRLEIKRRHHDVPLAGHMGQRRTRELVMRKFFWPQMKRDIDSYVRGCQLCARNKDDQHAHYGQLMPLEPPERPWSRIGFDMITDCPKTKNGNDAIFVIIDHFSKGVRLRATKMTLDAEGAADIIRKEVITKKGVMKRIVADRDRRWVNRFWKKLAKKLSFAMNLSTAFHPPTDGQTERINRVIEAFLRSYINYMQDDWEEWLDLAEFAINNSVHEAHGMTPFFIENGYDPELEVVPERPGEPVTETRAREYADFMTELQAVLRENLIQSQERNKKYFDRRRKEMTFELGDQVYLRTKNIRTRRPCKKLDQRKLGPYPVIEVINRNAYKLQLPPEIRIHPVFHVELLEKYVPPQEGQEIPASVPVIVDGHKEWEVDEILGAKRDAVGQLWFRVIWKMGDQTTEPATHLKDCNAIIRDFVASHQDCDALPFRASDYQRKKARCRKPDWSDEIGDWG